MQAYARSHVVFTPVLLIAVQSTFWPMGNLKRAIDEAKGLPSEVPWKLFQGKDTCLMWAPLKDHWRQITGDQCLMICSWVEQCLHCGMNVVCMGSLRKQVLTILHMFSMRFLLCLHQGKQSTVLPQFGAEVSSKGNVQTGAVGDDLFVPVHHAVHLWMEQQL